MWEIISFISVGFFNMGFFFKDLLICEAIVLMF